MYHTELYSNGSGHFLYEDPPLGSFVSMASSRLPDSVQFATAHTVEALELALLYGGQEGAYMPGGGVAKLPDGQYFLDTDDCQNELHTETEKWHGPPLPASSFDSLLSYSTLVAGHTMSSSAEQGEDSAKYLHNFLEGNVLYGPANLQLPLDEDYSSMYGAPSLNQAHESVRVPIENDGSFYVEESVVNSGMDVLRGVSRSARSWPCFVRVVCACHRFRSKIDMLKRLSKKGMNGKRKRSAASNKYPCEIRISTKIPRDGNYLKDKAWIGTFETPAQKGRALDVGKFFLSAKKKKIFSDPASEALLSSFKGRLQAMPLTKLVENVRKVAKYYGEKGSLPESLDDL